MPYEWSQPAPETQRLDMWPHRSLPHRGFAAFLLVTCLMFSMPLLALLGTAALWGLLPFLAGAVALIWWALEQSYKAGKLHETLIITPEDVALTQVSPGGVVQKWECNTFWVQAQLHLSDGPVPHYITLRGTGREAELGAFLSEDERKALYGELCDTFSKARRAT